VHVLVAGIGNIFLGDDGFGVEVVQRLRSLPLPESVRVVDVGIRGVHLAYELLDSDYDTAILIDAVPRGGPPGTLYLTEPDRESSRRGKTPDAHAMTPEAVLELLDSLGGRAPRVLVLGCEPASVEEGIGLSEPVARAVDEAAAVVVGLVNGSRSAGGTPLAWSR